MNQTPIIVAVVVGIIVIKLIAVHLYLKVKKSDLNKADSTNDKD